MLNAVEIWAHEPGRRTPNGDEWSCGSGHAIGGTLVLTSAHVVCPEDRPLTVIRIRQHGQLLKAQVAWHQSIDSTDAAVVKVDDSLWEPPAHSNAWGRLVTARPQQRFESTGFPDVHATPQHRDIEQASGTINPHTTAKGRRLALSVDDPPVRVRRSSSPWAGMSGAAVLCGERRLLTAVVVKDPAGFDSHRLSAVPVTEFLSDPTLAQLLAENGGQPTLSEAVELKALADTVPAAESPAMLLRPELSHIPFRPREELDELLAWCQTESAPSWQLLTGPGGQGKTRLAHQLSYVLSGEGWACLTLSRKATSGALEVLADLDEPLLVVVDYAETRLSQLAELVEQTNELRKTGQRLRLLLLARTAGDWQAAAPTYSRLLDRLPDLRPLHLGPLEPLEQGREDAWNEAITAFVAALPHVPGCQDVEWASLAAGVSPPALNEPRFDTILAIQMDALAALLSASDPAHAAGAENHSAISIILQHEERYWSKAARTNDLPIGRTAQWRAVATATLWGADTREEAHAVLAVTPGLEDLRDGEQLDVASWLADLYRESGRYWSRPQPDRLAEYIVASVLHSNSAPDLLNATLEAATPSQVSNALIVLTRSAVHDDQLATPIAELVTARPLTAGVRALELATWAEQPEPLLVGLRRAVDQADVDTLNAFQAVMPDTTILLADLGVQVSERLVKHWRRKFRHDTDHLPALAASLNTLAVRLGGVRDNSRAIAQAREAVKCYRELTRLDQDTYLPELGKTLHTLAAELRKASNRQEEAIAAEDEATGYYRQLAEADPAGYRYGLALQLFTLGTVLLEFCSRRHEPEYFWESLARLEEAAWHYRALADGDRNEANLRGLAMSLSYLSQPLGLLRCDEQSLARAEEGICYYRELVHASPDSYLLGLAFSLSERGQLWSMGIGTRKAALAAAEEASQYYQRVAPNYPGRFAAERAAAEDMLAKLRDNGEHPAANRFVRDSAVREEAVWYQRALAEADPAAHQHTLAEELSTLGNLLFEIGHNREALARLEEATWHLRELGNSEPDHYRRALAKALHRRAILYRDGDGHFEEALVAAREAAEQYQWLRSYDVDEAERADIERLLVELDQGSQPREMCNPSVPTSERPATRFQPKRLSRAERRAKRD